MSRRNIILLVVALLIAAITAFAMSAQMGAGEKAVVKEQTRNKANFVLVAKTDIPMGSFVRTFEQLEFREFKPEDIKVGEYITEQNEVIASFEGAVSRRAYRAGQPLLIGSLIKPGAGGFLSAVLEPGKRAVSIAVNATSGNAGFIFPGDFVDVILVNQMKTRDPATGETKDFVFSNTFLEKARVVAVDQQLDNPENKAILAKTVTIEVTPKQAEAVQVATEMGKVSFALRSISDPTTKKDVADGESGAASTDEDFVSSIEKRNDAGFTSSTEVSPALGNADYNATVHVVRGGTATEQNFTNASPK
jgi:pilus assembly protein CpaB